MRDLIPILDAWTADGLRAALCTVVSIHDRAPLPLGASLIVAEDGATAGAVSGGCVERQVIEVAQAVLRGAPARRLRFAPTGDELTDAALPCGGGIDVWVQAWGAGPLAGEQEAFVEAAREGLAARLRFTVGPIAATYRAEPTEGVANAGGPSALAVPPVGRMVLIGAGPIAGALCDLAPTLGMRAIVIDPREAVAAHAPIQRADELLLCWPEEAIARLSPLGEADAVIALTHHPAIDDVALRAAVAGGAGFVGALGSRRAHAARLQRLRERGVGEQALARIVGPIGLDLGGWSAGETALSIAAELVAVRHGRAGGRLVQTTGRIHAAAPARAPRRPELPGLPPAILPLALPMASSDDGAQSSAGRPRGAAPTDPLAEPSAPSPVAMPRRPRADAFAMPVAAVVLAAGAGRRFGGAKQTAQWDGEALVARAVRAASYGLPAGSDVIVVVGAHEPTVRAALPADVPHRVVSAEQWAQGIGASLRAGLAAATASQAPGRPTAVLVLLADQPLVDADLVATVAREGTALAARGAAAARPVVDGTPGHPVLLGPVALTRAADLEGDRGLAPLITGLYVHELEVEGRAPIVDVDHPADLLQAGPPPMRPAPRSTALVRRPAAAEPPATRLRRWT